MALARLERSLDHPNAVQLPTLTDWVGMVLEELLILLAIEVEFVSVVGNVHFLAANQLVVEAVLAARKHLQLIEQGHPPLAGHRRIEGELGSQLHPALARAVAEGTTRLG
ncbi:hypothetical protein D3C81_1292010 [compost metagenome]